MCYANDDRDLRFRLPCENSGTVFNLADFLSVWVKVFEQYVSDRVGRVGLEFVREAAPAWMGVLEQGRVLRICSVEQMRCFGMIGRPNYVIIRLAGC